MINRVDKFVLSIIILLSIVVLVFVFVSEYVFGFQSCILCKYQRIPYFAVILLGCLALHIKNINHGAVLRLIGIIFLFGTAIAAYHVGIEKHWWTAASCGVSLELSPDFDAFKLDLSVKMPKKCDEINWTFLGLSMAVYNVILSTFLALLCLAGNKCYRNLKLHNYEKGHN